MITILMEELEVNHEDYEVINKMYQADLKKNGVRVVELIVTKPMGNKMANLLYDNKGQECRQIARAWLRLLTS